MDWLNFPVSKIFSAHFSLFLRYTATLLAHYNLRHAFRFNMSWHTRYTSTLFSLAKWRPPYINLTTDLNKKEFLPLSRSQSYREQEIMNRLWALSMRASDRPPSFVLFYGICLEWTRERNTDYLMSEQAHEPDWLSRKARQIWCVATKVTRLVQRQFANSWRSLYGCQWNL